MPGRVDAEIPQRDDRPLQCGGACRDLEPSTEQQLRVAEE